MEIIIAIVVIILVICAIRKLFEFLGGILTGILTGIMIISPFVYGVVWWILNALVVDGNNIMLFWAISVVFIIEYIVLIKAMHRESETVHNCLAIQNIAATVMALLVCGLHLLFEIDGIYIYYAYLFTPIVFQLYMLSCIFLTRKSVVKKKVNNYFYANGAVSRYSMAIAVDPKDIITHWGGKNYRYMYDLYDSLCEELISQEMSKVMNCGRAMFYSEMRPFLDYCKSKKETVYHYVPDDIYANLFPEGAEIPEEIAFCEKETYGNIYRKVLDITCDCTQMITIMDAEQALEKMEISKMLENDIPSVSDYAKNYQIPFVESALGYCAENGQLELIPAFNGNPNIYQQPCKENGEPADLPPENTGEVLMLPFDDEEDNY